MGRQSSRDSQAICTVTIRAGLRAACGLLCQAYHELGKYLSIFLFRHLFISVFLKDFLDDAFSTQWEVELLEMGKRYAPPRTTYPQPLRPFLRICTGVHLCVPVTIALLFACSLNIDFNIPAPSCPLTPLPSLLVRRVIVPRWAKKEVELRAEVAAAATSSIVDAEGGSGV